MKKCSKCGELKAISEFAKEKKGRGGLRADCRVCVAAAKIKYYLEHPDQHKIESQRWSKNNPERRKELNRRWKENHPNYYQERREKHLERDRETQRKFGLKYRNTPKGNIEDRMSRYIGLVLKGNKAGRHWEELVDYTSNDLKIHIEKQFKDGMSWDNRKDWHIDHIIPQSAFNYEKPEDIDFKKCWALKNLQPMWARENIIKSDKLNKPFQPSLLIRGYLL